MKLIMIFATLLFTTLAQANFPSSSAGSAQYTKFNTSAPLEGIGDVLDHTKAMTIAVYDFAVLGGSIGMVSLTTDRDSTVVATLPQGAVVTNVVGYPVTAMTGTSATFALHLLSGSDLMVNQTAMTVGTNIAGVPVGTASTWKGPVTVAQGSSGSIIKMDIQSGAITAGKIKFFIEYHVVQ